MSTARNKAIQDAKRSFLSGEIKEIDDALATIWDAAITHAEKEVLEAVSCSGESIHPYQILFKRLREDTTQ